MKTFLPLSRLSILLTVLMTASAVAQVGVFPGGAYTGEAVPGVDTTGAFDPGANQSRHFLTRIATKFPGNVWFRYTGASEGLGYDTGGFFTVGAKTRLGTDLLDGRWMFEARGHLAHEQGQVFANIGVERIFTITPAKSDVGFNFFFDADGDASQNFGHDFYGVGVGGFLRHEKFEVRANGYIPVGTTGYRLGTPEDCFYLNHIIDQPGIDTALQGADLEVSLRPWHWQMLQGHVDVGGYYYADVDEDITGVGSFGGVRVRGRVTTNRGVSVEAEYNYDERFKATIIGRIVISTGTFGQFSRLGRDLDPTIRNDHVVKWHQDVTFLIDPDTGIPYFVRHVDNTAAAGGDGTVERPYDTLAAVDPTQPGGVSNPDDIIFVNTGDGTSNGYDTGITLQDRQYLFGDGSRNLIPTVRGTSFQLCNPVNGNKPTITNTRPSPAGDNIVTLANGNTVTGVLLDGNRPAPMPQNLNGIFGDMIGASGVNPAAVTITDSCIFNVSEDGIHINAITGGDVIITDNIIDGVGDDAIDIGGAGGIMAAGGMIDVSRNAITDTGLLTLLGGDGVTLAAIAAGGTTFNFDDNMLERIGGDGIEIAGVTGVGGNVWDFTGNMVDMVGEDGISIGGPGAAMIAATGDMFTFTMNTTTNAGMSGIFMDTIVDATGTATYSFVMNIASDNLVDGIHLEDFGGMSVFADSNVTSDNLGTGLQILRGTSAPLVGLDVDILDHTSDANTTNGMFFSSFDGDVDILGATVTNNVGNGINFLNVTNSVMDTSIDIAPNMATGTASTVSDNNVGATTGIRVTLDEMAALAPSITILNIIDTTLDNNGTGVAATVTGGAGGLMNDLRVTMDGLPSISGQRNDVVDFDTLSGATSTLVFINNATMTMNGTVAGDWLDLNVDSGPSGAMTTMMITVEDNTLVGVGGAGLRANVTGLSSLTGTFEDNSLTTVGSFGTSLTYNVSSAAFVNKFGLNRNTFTTTGGDAIRLATNVMSQVDFLIAGNTITNPTAARGIHVDANDLSTLRIQVLGNTLVDTTSTSRDGIDLAVADDAMLLGRVFGNSVTNFGGNGATTISVPGPAIADPFWGRGIIVTASETGLAASPDATMAIVIENNAVTGSALEGIGVYTTGGAKMDALVFNNTLTGNDVTSVTSTTPVPDQLDKLAGRYDFFSQTDTPGDALCLTLHGNFATNGYVAGEGPFDLTITPLFPVGVGMGTMRLEEGTNNLAARQTWLQGNVVVPFVPPTPPPVSVATPVFGVLGAPSLPVPGGPYPFDPATSVCITNYNAKVTALEMPGGIFDTTYPPFP